MVDEKIVSFLRDWMVRYIKNKDIITKKIVSIKEDKSDFDVIRSDREQRFFIEPFLDDLNSVLNKLKTFDKNKAIVCFHTKENYAVFVKNWKEFVAIGKTLAVYFVNPFSKLERVLIINPHTHELISDEDSLEMGLKTMAENVEFTTEEEVKKIVNS